MQRGDLLSFLLMLQKECGGVIPFERFMQEALYHPKFGYYAAQIREVGAGGDFSTSATLEESLGISIAAWITQRSRDLGWKRIPVIEIGAGNGALAKTVLKNLPWTLRWRIDYSIHETSAVLKRSQQQLLRWKGVRWISSLADALKQSKGRALIFSNELVDAFPCKLFQKIEGGWQELGVHIDGQNGLSEVIVGPASLDPCFSQFDHLPEGQRIERLDSFPSWLGSWCDEWKEGTMLTIDYGETSESLYNHRIEGSLRAYWRHQRLTGRDLYARFGKQDLTADVNFSDLIRWGSDLGWNHLPLMTQLEFITSWLPANTRTSLLKKSVSEGEAGDAFKVLEQRPLQQ